MTGAAVSVPAVTGPAVTGAAVIGPAVTGPAVTGAAVTGAEVAPFEPPKRPLLAAVMIGYLPFKIKHKPELNFSFYIEIKEKPILDCRMNQKNHPNLKPKT